jgi:two-component system CheB/CheR fusion protein
MNTSVQKPQILVVDDKAQHLFTVARLLKKLDVEVFEATSGSEALGLTLEHDFCVAIVDVQMPEMSGYELVELWRGNSDTVGLPVIFISGIGEDEYRHRKAFNNGGAVDFLGKPFIPEILLAKVGVFIELCHQRAKVQELTDELNETREALARATCEP